MNNTLNKIEVGERIRQLRLLNHYTQFEFAELLDISVNFLSEIENGKKGLSIETLARLCNGTTTSADYILFGDSGAQLDLISIVNSLPVDELSVLVNYVNSLIALKEAERERTTNCI